MHLELHAREIRRAAKPYYSVPVKDYFSVGEAEMMFSVDHSSESHLRGSTRNQARCQLRLHLLCAVDTFTYSFCTEIRTILGLYFLRASGLILLYSLNATDRIKRLQQRQRLQMHDCLFVFTTAQIISFVPHHLSL